MAEEDREANEKDRETEIDDDMLRRLGSKERIDRKRAQQELALKLERHGVGDAKGFAHRLGRLVEGGRVDAARREGGRLLRRARGPGRRE